MKIKDFINLWADGTHDDIDVYDDVCEELAIAYCGGYKLTKEGKKEFKEVLEYDILVDDDVAIVHVDDEEGIWQKKLKNAKRFFYAAAGYCDCDDYDRWFVEA